MHFHLAIQCSGGQVYTECGSRCPASCKESYTDSSCSEECVEGCFCPEGYAMDGEWYF